MGMFSVGEGPNANRIEKSQSAPTQEELHQQRLSQTLKEFEKILGTRGEKPGYHAAVASQGKVMSHRLPYDNLVASVLTKYRVMSGMSQTRLASKVGIIQKTLSRIETWDCPLGVDYLGLISFALGQTPQGILAEAATHIGAPNLEVIFGGRETKGSLPPKAVLDCVFEGPHSWAKLVAAKVEIETWKLQA